MTYQYRNLMEVVSSQKTMVLEDKNAYLKKFQNEPNVKATVDKFWNKVRQRVQGPQKDIEYWYKMPYSAFKDFVDSFDLSSKQEKKQIQQQYMRQAAEDEGAQMLGVVNGYEVWHVPTYGASIILGRNYKNRPTHWCISSDDPEYWYENYDRCEFLFLIRENPVGDEYDKVAIEFEDGGRVYNVDNIVVWDLNDNDDYDSELIPDTLLHTVWEMFAASGAHKTDVQQW